MKKKTRNKKQNEEKKPVKTTNSEDIQFLKEKYVCTHDAEAE